MTYTGRQFWPLEPRAEDVAIEDIAHALSMLCRYNGHCRYFYSVAEHSYLVWLVVSRTAPGDYRHQLRALLHDAAEAYLADVPRPVKPFLRNYQKAEKRINRAIAQAFNLPSLEKTDDIAYVDARILVDEAESLMPIESVEWHKRFGEPLGVPIDCLPPGEAEEQFLSIFRGLQAELDPRGVLKNAT